MGIAAIEVWQDNPTRGSNDGLTGLKVEHRLANGKICKGHVNGKPSLADDPWRIMVEPEASISQLTVSERPGGLLAILGVHIDYPTGAYATEVQGVDEPPAHLQGDVVALFGRAGDRIDALGVYVRPEPGPRSLSYRGGKGGSRFDDLFDVCGQIVGIAKVRVWTNGVDGDVRGLQTTYRLRNGVVAEAPRRGKGGVECAAFELAADEYIVQIRGREGERLHQINLVTNKKREAGPFGGTDGTRFDMKVGGSGRVTECVLAFYGSAGEEIDGIGAYVGVPRGAPSGA